jgi:hypothetical protein
LAQILDSSAHRLKPFLLPRIELWNCQEWQPPCPLPLYEAHIFHYA